MIVDLHAHFPMHLVPPVTLDGLFSVSGRRRWRDHLRAALIDFIGVFANYERRDGTPGVTVPLLQQGGVRVVLSPLYSAFDEIEELPLAGERPKDSYFTSIVDQLTDVENELAKFPGRALVAHDLLELDAALATPGDQVCFIHCIEGGHALGGDRHKVNERVADLAGRGVAYVTVAHLLWRGVATNAPAIPSLKDACYCWMFPQPENVGLSALGKAAVEAMIEHHVTVDVTHMSAASLADTFEILDGADRAREVPVIASHAGARLGSLRYNLDDPTLDRIIERNGAIGMMACAHFMSDPEPPPTTKQGAVDVICRHIDHIGERSALLRGEQARFDHVAIGSDLDGFAKPSLHGLVDASALGYLEKQLIRRYGVHASKICSDNVLRVLRTNWR